MTEEHRHPVGPAARDHIWLTSVGVDVGSATSHLTISELHLQRLGEDLSSRFVTVERSVLYQSVIILTPYLVDGSIDADALATFTRQAYQSAGMTPEEVDTGAVILTGEAVKRRNARAISARLASMAGSFVSATAGPRLEALTAAHGSGAVQLSRRHPGQRILNIDIGGGTTKFALTIDGRVESTGAVSVGGRLIATDRATDVVIRLEPDGAWFRERTGVDVQLGKRLTSDERRLFGQTMAEVILRVLSGGGHDPDIGPLWVTDPFLEVASVDAIVFSGGVARYVLAQEDNDFGDLGIFIGEALRSRLQSTGLWQKVAESSETIRATVLGASQYTVQVTGNTVSVTNADAVPISNLRVVAPGIGRAQEAGDPSRIRSAIQARIRDQDIDDEESLAFAVQWRGVPHHSKLLALAEGLASAGRARDQSSLVVLVDSDVGRSLGHLLNTEVDWVGDVVCLDGIAVDDFDFVDIGARLEPSGTYPVVVKSLVYPASEVCQRVSGPVDRPLGSP